MRALAATPFVCVACAACATHPTRDAAPKADAPRATARTSAATGASARFLALGDSFTIGTGSAPERSFPARLAGRWGCAIELRNVAVNGYTARDVIGEELPELTPFAPTFVTVAVGANDIVQGNGVEHYRQEVREILASVARAGVKEIITIPQPDWALSPTARAFGDPAPIEQRIVVFNSVLREETAAVGGRYIDLFGLMQAQAREGRLAKDQLHPSADAYDAWAAELARSVPSPCGTSSPGGPSAGP
jgi:acyl-CoA thioesterase I